MKTAIVHVVVPDDATIEALWENLCDGFESFTKKYYNLNLFEGVTDLWVDKILDSNGKEID